MSELAPKRSGCMLWPQGQRRTRAEESDRRGPKPKGIRVWNWTGFWGPAFRGALTGFYREKFDRFLEGMWSVFIGFDWSWAGFCGLDWFSAGVVGTRPSLAFFWGEALLHDTHSRDLGRATWAERGGMNHF